MNLDLNYSYICMLPFWGHVFKAVTLEAHWLMIFLLESVNLAALTCSQFLLFVFCSTSPISVLKKMGKTIKDPRDLQYSCEQKAQTAK